MNTAVLSMLLLLCAFRAGAQVISGTITGSVVDPSNAAIPGAKVIVTNVETGLTRDTASNESGLFTFATLPPGRYTVSASHEGFKAAEAANLELLVDHLAGWLASGWQLNGIPQLQAGFPFSVTESADRANTGVNAPERPNRVGNGILPDSEKTRQRWFDTSAYVVNPLNTYGNAGRNTLRQDGVKSADLSLFKNNFITERRLNLQFRAEFFNSLNNVNFGRPGYVIDGSAFGVVGSAGDARQIQFALKLMF
jgi:hypothetical protein